MRSRRAWRCIPVLLVMLSVLASCGVGDTGAAPAASSSPVSMTTASPTSSSGGTVAGARPLVIVVDGSGTMTQTDVAPTRFAAAKSAASALVSALPEGTPLGVLTYGTGTGNADTDKPAGCRDVTRLVPVVPLDAPQRSKALAGITGITASGYTPIGLALTSAVEALPEAVGAVVLVSDGEDSCAPPDPCETARTLKGAHPQLTISAVGLRTGGQAGAQLACIANAADGVFVTADDTTQLTTRLLATRDVGAARAAVTSTGVGRAQLGQKYAQIQASEQGFPDWSAATTYRGAGVPGDGLVILVWRDCSYVFDGTRTLVAVQAGPAGTIDQVRVGDALTRATAVYGPALATETNADGTRTSLYRADSTTGTAYRITFDAAERITVIVLCRCLPTRPAASTTATMDSFGPVRIGMTLAQVNEALGAVKTGESGGAACTLVTYRWGPGIATAAIHRPEGVVRFIDTPKGTMTDRGVGDGSTEAQIRAAYGRDYAVLEAGGQGMPGLFVAPRGTDPWRASGPGLGFGMETGRAGPPRVGGVAYAEYCSG